ncbi:acyltransferase family protein [Streptococcus sp. S784/96/1]|uniref:acyltransferase family protein n=1 Tax=Streptococcus sp. S784/96/1 TaxID=2653499 RepID=UPI0013898A7E|nr:acyltransferase [Streptococcus sp. S784/96/1]
MNLDCRQEVDVNDNSFDYIRIACAILILFGHYLTHFKISSDISYFVAYFVRGVPIFFFLSGFFTARSMERYTLRNFFKNRLFRLYPPLWLCMLINLFIILIFYVVKPTVKDLMIYSATQFTFLQFYGGNWLSNYGVGVPNGALWTIAVDIQYYLIVIFVVKYLKQKSLKVWLSVVSSFATLSLLIDKYEFLFSTIIFKLLSVSLIPFFYIFLFGMMLYYFKDRLIPLILRYKWWIVSLYIIWSLLPTSIRFVFSGVRYNVVSTLLLLITLIVVGYGFGKHRLKTDYSYAFYLYHMVVINFVKDRFHPTIDTGVEAVLIFLLIVLVTSVLSYGSVQLLDKRLIPRWYK